MHDRTFTTLELPALLTLLAGQVQTPLGRRKALALQPSTDRDWIIREQARTSECVDYLTTGGVIGLGEIRDPEDSITTLQIAGTTLEPLEILALQSFIAIGLDLQGKFDQPEAKAVIHNFRQSFRSFLICEGCWLPYAARFCPMVRLMIMPARNCAVFVVNSTSDAIALSQSGIANA